MADVVLVIDVQQALLEELTPGRGEELLATLAPLLERARRKRMPIVYVLHDGSPTELVPGTPGWRVAEAIAPHAGDAVVEKRNADAFVETTLSETLADLGAERLIVTGMQTDVCVRATVRGAVERGYRVTLVADAHATAPWGDGNEAQIRDTVHAESGALGAWIVSAVDAL